MRQIELRDGYLVCVTCKGYIEAGNLTPACECIEGENLAVEALVVN